MCSTSDSSDPAKPNTILVVDDEAPIRDYLSEVLRFGGYECRCFSESAKALSYLTAAEEPADLMLADISMPGMGGIDLLRNVKSIHPGLPVILVSGLYELSLALDAVNAGADDYLRKPVKPKDVVSLVDKYLKPNPRARQLQQALREFVSARPASGKAFDQVLNIFRRFQWQRYETVQHSKRVAVYARLLGERYGLGAEALYHLELGALLHDIGKIGVPVNVLLKPGGLSENERQVMRTHPRIGFQLLTDFPELGAEAEVVLNHHESYDGTGYPRGLKEEQIPLAARIFSIADTFDAITSNRPYRRANSVDLARREVVRMSGRQFDPRLIQVFDEIPDAELTAVMERYPDEVPLPAAG